MIWCNFATIIWLVLHKKTFLPLEKWKMVFSSKENENFLRQHCLPFQDAPLCTIWDHLNNYAMNVAIRLIIWLESHESSRMTAHFWEHIKIIIVLQVYYFPGNLVIYNDTMRRFSNFLIIFWIFYARFKMRSKRRAWPFLASGWILETFWCFYD